MSSTRTIKTRIVSGFIFFAFLISLLFSFYNFIFAYVVEDEFFHRLVTEEAEYIDAYYEKNGDFPAPRQELFSLYTSVDVLPDDIRQTYIEEPFRKEIAGEENRHYHLVSRDGSPGYILVAEISDILVVRPIRNKIMVFLAISCGVMLVLAGAFGYWTATRTTRPLTRLAALISHSEPDTLPKQFAAEYPNNEIGLLASSLEQAMQRIAEFIEREQHFTRDTSHELRTPIAVIKGATELLEQQETNEKNRELVSRIKRACNNMEQTVETLLMLAREQQSASIHPSTRVLPLVEQSILNHHFLLTGKDVEVEVEVAPDITVAAEEPVVAIILGNLVSNAFQYTSSGTVSIAADANCVRVKDTGSGFDASIRDDAFKPLVKGKDSKGFGIGLSIVERLCEKYQFAMTMQSSEEGTCIDIRFG